MGPCVVNSVGFLTAIIIGVHAGSVDIIVVLIRLSSIVVEVEL